MGQVGNVYLLVNVWILLMLSKKSILKARKYPPITLWCQKERQNCLKKVLEFNYVYVVQKCRPLKSHIWLF